MSIALTDLFKIGIGPSSSHTVGPMWAGWRFVEALKAEGIDPAGIARVEAHLYGSLALTGRGHATDKAVILGLAGLTPDTVDPDEADTIFNRVRVEGTIPFAGVRDLPFREGSELHFHMGDSLPHHPNGLRFIAFDKGGMPALDEIYYSVGGGFVLSEKEATSDGEASGGIHVPHTFETADELIARSMIQGKTIARMMLENERAFAPADDIHARVLKIWTVMEACIDRGCRTDGVLPGGLNVKRRARRLHEQLVDGRGANADVLSAMDWISLFALAVNEENAAGGRVVTAPTNGAAGVIPAVLAYYMKFVPGANEAGVVDFLATAGAIGVLYKKNASISAAEVGCQGEVGVACSMAAAGLAAVMGGSPQQIENAAEIGMEHNLGLTCDPIGGLVQIPCIERNTMGAIKAINAAKLAMRGDGTHFVSLDQVIETMRQTGRDMSDKYKETALGGLAITTQYAVNRTEC